MTTIAYDGLDLACDSQVSTGITIYGSASKIEKVTANSPDYKGEVYVGYAGDIALYPLFIDFIKTGDTRKFEKHQTEKSTFEALVIRSDGKILEYENDYGLLPQHYRGHTHNGKEIRALGSGANFALAAMLCNRNAQAAVNIACTLDCYSSGVVTFLRTVPYDDPSNFEKPNRLEATIKRFEENVDKVFHDTYEKNMRLGKKNETILQRSSRKIKDTLLGG